VVGGRLQSIGRGLDDFPDARDSIHRVLPATISLIEQLTSDIKAGVGTWQPLDQLLDSMRDWYADPATLQELGQYALGVELRLAGVALARFDSSDWSKLNYAIGHIIEHKNSWEIAWLVHRLEEALFAMKELKQQLS
jgi:hypothetical protein